MKAHYSAFAIAAFTVLAAISCTQEAYPETSGTEMTFTATYEEDGATRTVLGDNGSVLWSPGDEVSIFKGIKYISSNKGSKFVSQNTAPAKTVEFKGYLNGLGGLSSGEYYWAIYPYSENNEIGYSGTADATLPATQTAVPGTFAEKCHPAVARSATTSLKFYAACGGLKFTVSRSDIKSVSIKGNDDEHLAGPYCVAFDDDGNPTVYSMGGAFAENEVTLVAPDGGTFTPGESYFISILPATLSKGITITLEAIGQRGTIVSTKPQTIKRSVFGVLNNLDSKAEWSYVADAVDLGLSVKWASFNIGASKPEEYGDYYAWGETEPKAGYEWGTYKWCNGDTFSFTKYCTSSYTVNWGGSGTPDNRFLLEPEDDAARTAWGEGWRMPTEPEMKELIDDCTWTWTDNYNGTGVHGYIVSGKKSGYTGNSIFLPAAGRRHDINLLGEGSTGRYWSSNNLDYGENAASLSLSSGSVSVGTSARCIGFPVRPVQGEFIYFGHSFDISPYDLEIEVGETETLNIIVEFDDATDRRVFWTTSDPTVAEVTQTGIVTGKKAGTAKIHAYGFNGRESTSCIVTVKEPVLQPEMVDLGLSVKWASFNVGATEPSEYGDYFAWGETETKTSFSWNNYLWGNGTLKKYNWNSDYGTVDDCIRLQLADDAANASYGGQWRMPTYAEWEELRSNCTWTWTKDYNGTGIKGYIVSGKKSGYTDKSIFLPAAGSMKYSHFNDVGVFGVYWSSAVNTEDNPFEAYNTAFHSSAVEISGSYRYLGYCVRAVYGDYYPEYYLGAIDLDLPSGTKWATCNVGASKPGEYGDYFAWGETEKKDHYQYDNYKWCQGTYNTLTKYCDNSEYGQVDNKRVLEPEDDAAHAALGDDWRMPTVEDWRELKDNCDRTKFELNGIGGYKISSKTSPEKWIFLPHAGYWENKSNCNNNALGQYHGFYWSSSLSEGYPTLPWSLHFTSYTDYFNISSNSFGRYTGGSVRPVRQ